MTETVITEKPLLEEIREKSFDQLVRDQYNPEDQAPQHTEETDEEKKKKDDEKRVQADKEKIESESRMAEERKWTEDIAQKAAQQVLEKQRSEEQEKLDKVKAEEDEKKRLEDLKPRFTGKDRDGNTVPLSYEELHAEDVRVAEERAVARIHAELKAVEETKQAEITRQTQTLEQQKSQQKSIEDQLQKELDSDLRDLYSANKMPKISDPKNENDPGNKEFKNLFETAQRVNGERMAQGLSPIRSIKLIYYEHYKPLAPPPGHDSPVFGNESTISSEPPADKYVVSRDRGKSMAQLVKEEAARLGKRLNVRGS